MFKATQLPSGVCVIQNCCFSVLKNPPFRLIPLPVGLAFPRLFQNSSPHPLPQKAAPDTSRLPAQMPLQANIPTSLFWAQLALVPSLSKLSGLPLLYFWEGNSVSGPTSAAHPQVSNCPVWAVDNLEVTAKMLPWKMWWEKREERQKSRSAPEDGWVENLCDDFYLKINPSDAIKADLRWPSPWTPRSLDPCAVVKRSSICTQASKVCNLLSSFQSYWKRTCSFVTCGVLGQQL